MRLEHQILCAMGLDLVLGDPRWLPHPVRFIGRFAAGLEAPTRKLLPARAAGVATALLTVAVAGLSAWALVKGARSLHPVAGDVAAILILWTTLAARDLAGHAAAVGRALASSDLAAARACLGRMVGRDTNKLDEAQIVRGTVESVAENTTDGVIAPLFYACLFGPVGAMVYKAISTLDSTFGYRTPRYQKFGWASARTDDVAAFVPARITAPLMVLASWLSGLHPANAARILVRDGGRHPSPNAGLAEAAMAGALGVELGGLSYYLGEPSWKPTLGDPREALSRRHIDKAIRLMLLTTGIAAALFLGVRMVIGGPA
jgi:adenosylcobinamide-phosphate synthase